MIDAYGKNDDAGGIDAENRAQVRARLVAIKDVLDNSDGVRSKRVRLERNRGAQFITAKSNTNEPSRKLRLARLVSCTTPHTLACR